MLTPQDYRDYKNKVTTAQAFATKHNVSTNKVYTELRKYKSLIPRNILSNEQKAALKAELRQAVPYDLTNNIKSVLERYNLRDISHACQVLKEKNLSSLRTGNAALGKVLIRLKLRLIKNALYSPGKRDAALWLEDDELRELQKTPLGWCKKNVERLKSLYPVKRIDPLKTKKRRKTK
jgi:hypothetical protein